MFSNKSRMNFFKLTLFATHFLYVWPIKQTITYYIKASKIYMSLCIYIYILTATTASKNLRTLKVLRSAYICMCILWN